MNPGPGLLLMLVSIVCIIKSYELYKVCIVLKNLKECEEKQDEKAAHNKS